VNLKLDTFICLDIETTGLDPGVDKIIEIGAVKYHKGKKTATFSSLINPGIPIPPDIVELTGIDNKMVSSAPDIEEVIKEFEAFLGKFPLVVGQNVRFDLSFLKHHLSSWYRSIIDVYFIDTSALARLVWPGLKSYGLSHLANFIGLRKKPDHRAYTDAKVTSEVYLYELAALVHFPQKIKNFAAGLMFGQQARGEVLSSLERHSEYLPKPVEYEYDFGDNIIGGSEIEPVDDYRYVDIDDINEIFDNRFRQVLDDYEERPQQLQMAVETAGAFNHSEILLAEAPTGIGKSLAYLVPAILWANTNGEGIIVSTQTKNLQDQLFNKDIPLLMRAIDFKFKAVLLKGRGNYLCLFKYYEFLNEVISSFSANERLALMALVVWAETTKTGDIAECSGFYIWRWQYLWGRISCEGNFCLGRTCRYYSRCFLFRVRDESLSAHIRVVNHHLLFADFASGGDMLAVSGHAILDEAHNLEKVAASYLGLDVGHSQFISLFNQVFTIRPVETGFLTSVKMKSALLDRVDSENINKNISKIQRALGAARNDQGEFFDKLASSFSKHNKGRNGARELSYSDISKYVPADVIENCRTSLKKLESALMAFADELTEFDQLRDKKELALRGKALAQDLRELRLAFSFLTDADDKEYVFWMEMTKQGGVRMLCAPLEVGKILDEKFYDQLKTLILSSATLSVAGDFTYYKSRLGLNLSAADRTCQLALDSPFNLTRNIGFFEAGFMPPPNLMDFNRQAAEVIFNIFRLTKIRGMVLFTSYKSITSVVETVGGRLMEEGFELFVQDGSLSPFQLLSRYRRSPRGIIFGTDSFWEGVDLPGEELELLVITKLPFSVPDRPWIKANLEKIEAAGGNPFFEFSLPEAAIKFRQGFGRLIRKKTDVGCVVVLDSRLSGKKYGRYFSESVEPELQLCPDLKNLLSCIKRHLEEMNKS
jgi:predicted DnaQ family exonuclease/DinG family helicase